MNASEQQQLVRDGAAGALIDRDVISATGPDAETFLQGQLSQDIGPLAAGQGAWTLLLEPQGKVSGWFRVTRLDAETFVLDMDAGAHDDVLERLNRFKLRTKIEFETLDWKMLAIRGPQSPVDLLAPGSQLPRGVAVAGDPQWGALLGVDLLGQEPEVPSGVTLVDAAVYELERIRAAVPAMGTELHPAVIPAEAGVVDRSVSFTKGCYTGQELVARIDSRGGNVPRNLRLVVAEAAIEAGQSVLVDGAVVGEITSAAHCELDSQWLGLAYIKRAVQLASGEKASGLVESTPATISAP